MHEQLPRFVVECPFLRHICSDTLRQAQSGKRWFVVDDSGIPIWEMQNGGFRPKEAGGLVVEEPMLNDLYGGTIRLLELPRATEKTLKASQEERPLSVLHHRYPMSWSAAVKLATLKIKRIGGNPTTARGREFLIVLEQDAATKHTQVDSSAFANTAMWLILTTIDGFKQEKGCGYADSKLEIQYGRNAAVYAR